MLVSAEMMFVKPGFHMIGTVGDTSPRQARGHIGDGCVKWKHILNDVADQMGTVWGRIERVQTSLKPGFYMMVTEIVSICRRLIGDMSPMCRSTSPTVTIIWKPGLTGYMLHAASPVYVAEKILLGQIAGMLQLQQLARTRNAVISENCIEIANRNCIVSAGVKWIRWG